MMIITGLILVLSMSGSAEEKISGDATTQACRVLFLGDNTWHGGTLRHVLETLAMARGQKVEITETPAKGRPLGEVIAGLLESTSDKKRWDVVVVFDHPLRLVVQRDRDELMTEIAALKEVASRTIWTLLPYQKPSLRVETERQQILARLCPDKGFHALPLVRVFHQVRQLGGGATWLSDLTWERPTSFSDYITACLVTQVIWGLPPQLPNDIRINDTATLHIPEESLPILAKVFSGVETTSLNVAGIAGEFAPELSLPQRLASGDAPLTLTSGVIPGFLDWNGDDRFELVLCERAVGRWEIWKWSDAKAVLSLAQDARFPATTVSPEITALINSGATVYQVVDFDYDRRPDMLIGTNDGRIVLCRGQSGMAFGLPEVLRFEDGKPFQVPYLHRAYLGELTKDGVWDLVLGDKAGQVLITSLVEKEGKSAWAQPRPVSIGGLLLQVEGEASPVLADWDLDGMTDLVVGSRNGSVLWLRNIGSGDQVTWAPPVSLVWPCEEEKTLLIPYREGVELWAPTPGWSTQPAITDLDGDHLPDLILGDSNCRVVKFRDLSPDEQLELDALLKKRMELLQKISQSPPEAITSNKAALWELTLELIQKSTNKRYERCGWVWYFQRKSLATPEE